MNLPKRDQVLLAEAYDEVVEEGLRNKLLGGLALAGLAAGGYKAMSGDREASDKQPGIEQSANQEYKIGDSLVTVFKTGSTTVIEVKTDIRKSLGSAKGEMRAEAKNKQHAEKIADQLGFSSHNLTVDTENSEDTGDYVLRYYKIDPSAEKLSMGDDTNQSNSSNTRTFVSPDAFND